MSFIRKLFGLGPKTDCQELLNNGAILIDVRTPAEYTQGKSINSQNIPLDQIGNKIDKIKKLNKPVVLWKLSRCRFKGLRMGNERNDERCGLLI